MNRLAMISMSMLVLMNLSCKKDDDVEPAGTNNPAPVNPQPVTSELYKEYTFPAHQVLICNFDGQGAVKSDIKRGFNSTGWSTYDSPPASEIKEASIVTATGSVAEGKAHLKLKGKAGENMFFAGGMYAPLDLSSFSGNNPADIYFNAFINNGGSKSGSLGITLVSSGIKYTFMLDQNWDGWKLISLKLSDFKNADHEPLSVLQETTAMDIGLNALEKGTEIETNMDYIVFTKGIPLKK